METATLEGTIFDLPAPGYLAVDLSHTQIPSHTQETKGPEQWGFLLKVQCVPLNVKAGSMQGIVYLLLLENPFVFGASTLRKAFWCFLR